MTKNVSGFTIVELLVVISIIGILSTLGLISYDKIQTDARDQQRDTSVKVIGEALEKYYTDNGEYPGCTAITQAADTVTNTTLKDINIQSLRSPNAATAVTNSIQCSGTPTADNDILVYSGDASTNCTTGSACIQWTIQYVNESTGEVVSLKSRHQSPFTVGAPIITTTVNSVSQITVNWSSTKNAISYQAQCSTDGGITWDASCLHPASGTSYVFGSLITGKKYYFRVQAINGGYASEWSDVKYATTNINTPSSAPTLSATMSGSTAIGTTGAVTCAANTTAKYQTQTNTNDGAWSSWSTLSATVPVINITSTNQGYKYGFNSRALCSGADVDSATTTTTTASVIRSISQPSAPGWLSGTWFQSAPPTNDGLWVNYSYSCPAGTWITNQRWTSRDWLGQVWGPYTWGAFFDQWEGVSNSTQAVEYWGAYNCKTNYTTSASSPDAYTIIQIYRG